MERPRAKRPGDAFLARHPELLHDDQRDYAFVRKVVRWVEPLVRYHQFECAGLDRVPDGPCILVANHSAAAIQEGLLLLRAWDARFGDRPARGLAHRAVFAFPWRLFPLLPKLGGIFAHPDVARRALAAGCALLIFPGGEVEVSRPFSDRHLVTLGDRSGFVRIARDAGVPIVPVVFCGSHASYVVVPGAQRIARFFHTEAVFGVKAVPMTVGGLGLAAALANPLLWPLLPLAAAQAVMPYPSQITAEALDPITVAAGESDAEVLHRVRTAMQVAMDRLVALRPESLLERAVKALGGVVRRAPA